MKHQYKEIPESIDRFCVQCKKALPYKEADADQSVCSGSSGGHLEKSFFHVIPENQEIATERIEHTITVGQVREHMKNNFRFKYFVTCLTGKETEIIATTSNGWVYVKNGRSVFCGNDKSVIARREG